MHKIDKHNLRGEDWKECIIQEGDTWVILDSDCWIKVRNKRPPMPIPKTFVREIEKASLKQGGCCGKPSKSI